MAGRIESLDRIGSEARAIGEDLVACAVVPEEIPPGLLEEYAERFEFLSGRLRLVRLRLARTSLSVARPSCARAGTALSTAQAAR